MEFARSRAYIYLPGRVYAEKESSVTYLLQCPMSYSGGRWAVVVVVVVRFIINPNAVRKYSIPQQRAQYILYSAIYYYLYAIRQNTAQTVADPNGFIIAVARARTMKRKIRNNCESRAIISTRARARV